MYLVGARVIRGPDWIWQEQGETAPPTLAPPITFARSSRTTSFRYYILFCCATFLLSVVRLFVSIFSIRRASLYLENARRIFSRSKRGRMVFPEVIFRLPEHMPPHIPIIGCFQAFFFCVAFPVFGFLYPLCSHED